MVVPNEPGCNRNTGSIGDLGAEISIIYSVLECMEYGACQTLRGFLYPFLYITRLLGYPVTREKLRANFF